MFKKREWLGKVEKQLRIWENDPKNSIIGRVVKVPAYELFRYFEDDTILDKFVTYFDLLKREVKPHVPDAWINTSIRDHKDGQVGKVGYEINFNRCFYKYSPPRPLEEIDAEIKELEREIIDMMKEI